MQSRSDVTLIKIMNQNIWLLFLNLLFTIHLSHLILIWCTSSQKTCHKKNNRLAVKDQQTNNNHSRVSCRLSDLGLYRREEIFEILFCLWHRLCVVLQKLKKVKNIWSKIIENTTLQKTSLSRFPPLASNWSRLVAKVGGATCIGAAGALEKIGGRAIALFQNRSRTVYHRCRIPLHQCTACY